MAITDWPKQERPREKLLKKGASFLSNAELIAIFLQNGVKGKTALDLARELLTHFVTLKAILTAPEGLMSSFKGIGKAKCSMLQAALELGRRYLEEDLQVKIFLSNAQEVKKFLVAKLASYKQEVFSCLFLTNKNQLIEYKELFFGTINCAPVYPRIIAQKALENNAGAVIFAHNHPSGDATPSKSDVASTQNLVQVLQSLDIQVLDHIIVGSNHCVAFSELGLL
jgi:DNA repair protein RadC